MTENGVDRDDDPTAAGTTQWRHVTQHRYEPDEDAELTAAILFAVADAESVPASAVCDPPLYDVVDVEAMERVLFEDGSQLGSGAVSGTVGFRYRAELVRVRSDGWILVYVPSESRS